MALQSVQARRGGLCVCSVCSWCVILRAPCPQRVRAHRVVMRVLFNLSSFVCSVDGPEKCVSTQGGRVCVVLALHALWVVLLSGHEHTLVFLYCLIGTEWAFESSGRHVHACSCWMQDL